MTEALERVLYVRYETSKENRKMLERFILN